MTCPLCHSRPAKRQCPALGHSICSVCCGTKRLVEIRCTPDCAYLASARRHPAASVQRQHEFDVALMLPAMTGFSDRQSRFFFLFQSVLVRHPERPAAPAARRGCRRGRPDDRRHARNRGARSDLRAERGDAERAGAFGVVPAHVRRDRAAGAGSPDAARTRRCQGASRSRGGGAAGGAHRRRPSSGIPGARPRMLGSQAAGADQAGAPLRDEPSIILP